MIEFIVFYVCGMVVTGILFGEKDLYLDIKASWNWPWRVIKDVWRLLS